MSKDEIQGSFASLRMTKVIAALHHQLIRSGFCNNVAMGLTVLEFVRKWNASQLTERQGSQPHFRDLCDMLGVLYPTESDEIGNNYTFEKRVSKLWGGRGSVDVWKRGYFAWEYKSKGEDLRKAYQQVSNYHEDLGNPPLLVVCDFVRFEVHTKFENSPTRVYAFVLDDLLVNRDTATCALPPLEVLRALFGDYNPLRPENTAARVTRAAASDLLRLATRLQLESRAEKLSREQIAHFLMRTVFCLFADSIGLLPKHTFRDLVLSDDRFRPTLIRRKLRVLFQAMAEKDGIYGPHTIPWFNGGLFTDDWVIELDLGDLGILASAAQHDWSHIEPTIFGTLFERSLDAAKRSLIGAHYTSTEDILLLVNPVVMVPLERRWAAVKAEAEAALAAEGDANGRLALDRPALHILTAWVEELAKLRVLDPACGSGNFLYVALRRLLDLWWEAQRFAVDHKLALLLEPIPSPVQLYGIETDFYAHEIASVVVWIGFLQWKHEHGVVTQKEPLLEKLTNIEKGDAILRYDAEGKPYEPEWPAAEFVVGNPPFLGGSRLRLELGQGYVDALQQLYESRVAPDADLVVYWFERARIQIKNGTLGRVGLLATQAIRGGVNRQVLKSIKQTGDIFMAWQDRKWQLEGAAVHVSIIAFDDGSETIRTLDDSPVSSIFTNLTHGTDTASAAVLLENDSLCFRADEKGGPFDLNDLEARALLQMSVNVNGRPNSDVLRPWINADDITGRPCGRWIIDFFNLSQEEASFYEGPFEELRRRIAAEQALVGKTSKKKKRVSIPRMRWWLH